MATINTTLATNFQSQSNLPQHPSNVLKTLRTLYKLHSNTLPTTHKT